MAAERWWLSFFFFFFFFRFLWELENDLSFLAKVYMFGRFQLYK